MFAAEIEAGQARRVQPKPTGSGMPGSLTDPPPLLGLAEILSAISRPLRQSRRDRALP